jgi:hypothetical protein
MNPIIITVGASFLGIAIGITFQKYMNDRDKKFSAYIEIMEAIAESTSKETRAAAIRKYILAKQKIIFYGSSTVIQQLSKISNFDARNKQEYDDYLDLIIMMRAETSIILWKKSISKITLRKLLG